MTEMRMERKSKPLPMYLCLDVNKKIRFKTNEQLFFCFSDKKRVSSGAAVSGSHRSTKTARAVVVDVSQCRSSLFSRIGEAVRVKGVIGIDDRRQPL